MHCYGGYPQIWLSERCSFSLHVSPQLSVNLCRTFIEWEYLYVRPDELFKLLDKELRPVAFKGPVNQFANSYCCRELFFNIGGRQLSNKWNRGTPFDDLTDGVCIKQIHQASLPTPRSFAFPLRSEEH